PAGVSRRVRGARERWAGFPARDSVEAARDRRRPRDHLSRGRGAGDQRPAHLRHLVPDGSAPPLRQARRHAGHHARPRLERVRPRGGTPALRQGREDRTQAGPPVNRAAPAANPLAFLDEALDQLRADGLYRRLRVLDGEQAHTARFDGRDVINLSSNNYLGLTTHPALREAAIRAVRELGAGSGSVRTIAGTMELHMELERRIAAFKHTEAAVVFQSGFAANAGTVAAILGKEDLILS